MNAYLDQGLRCNQGQGAGVGLSTCLCLHAEENALLEAGRDRIREGSILYCDTWVDSIAASYLNRFNLLPSCPCLTCSIKIVQVGISEVVYSQGYSMDKEVRCNESQCLFRAKRLQTASILQEGGVTLRQFSPVRHCNSHIALV